MEELAGASKESLVEIVKFIQKKGMKGEKGGWKEFLKVHDKQMGDSLSDPMKRSTDVLLEFIKTFKEEGDLKLFVNVMNCRINRDVSKQILVARPDESPEESLIRMTIQHPLYALDYTFPSYEEDWVRTKISQYNKNKLLAVDCEMVLCEDGSEALAKICVVDRGLKVKLHEFVNPHKVIADYRTHITGVTAEDLNAAAFSLKDVQKSMIKLLTHGAILVGHSLSNDLKALKLDHARVIDTSFIFKYGDESAKIRPSLNALCKTLLGFEVRKKDAPHNCQDDACAAMKLVLAKIKDGHDDVIPMLADTVPDSEKNKLLVHCIPVSMPSEDLKKYIDGEFTIEVLKSKKAKSERYSALAIFESSAEALKSFESIQGLEGEDLTDSGGRPQKAIYVNLSSGPPHKIHIRQMTRNSALASSKKRPCPAEEISSEPNKVLKTEQAVDVSTKATCVEHLEEIKWLRNMLKKRDEDVANLHELIAKIVRKQGL